MYCRNCGNQIDDKAVICPRCGASVNPGWNPQQPQQFYNPGVPAPKVGFLKAVSLFFTRYFDFQGRSRRSEYWWVSLFECLVITPLYILAIIGIAAESDGLMAFTLILMILYLLGTFIPNLAITFRRLHDIGKSGWWYLISFIPSVGSTIILVLCCLDSTPDNQWGPNPKFIRQ